MVHGAVQGNTLCVVLDSQAVATVVLHTHPSQIAHNAENCVLLDDFIHGFSNLSRPGRTRTMI